ncbi:archease [Candidatus Woesearchaeota archaeon]|nr:archease [Candidatus Woesearchaeota archaeon]
MNYRFLEDVAIADIAFEAFGRTIEMLFRNCAIATEAVQCDVKNLKKKITKEFEVKGKNEKELLYNFLEELIYYKDAEGLLFSSFKISIVKKGELHLNAVCKGQEVNSKTRVFTDVKAVTHHMFELSKKEKQWYARVVLDI